MRGNATLVSIVVALLLVLAVPSGAVAQTKDNAPVYVELDNPLCAVELHATGGNFGTWKWDGALWMPVGDDHTLGFRADYLTSPFGRCMLIVSFGGLASAGGKAIDTSHFSAYRGTVRVQTFNWAILPRGFDDIVFTYTLDSVSSTTPPGRYEGMIVVTVANVA